MLEWSVQLRDKGLTALFTTYHPHHTQAVANDALLMFDEHNYVCEPVDCVFAEANLLRLYGVTLRQVAFVHEGEMLISLLPVYHGLRWLLEAR